MEYFRTLRAALVASFPLRRLTSGSKVRTLSNQAAPAEPGQNPDQETRPFVPAVRDYDDETARKRGS